MAEHLDPIHHNTIQPASVPASQSTVVRDRADVQSIPVFRRRLLALIGFPMAWFFINHYMEVPRGFYMAVFWPVFLLTALWYLKDELRRRDLLVFASGAALMTGSLRSAVYAAEPLTILNFFALPLLAVFTLILCVQNHPGLTGRPFLSTLESLSFGALRSQLFLPAFFKGAGPRQATAAARQTTREVLTGIFIAAPLVFLLMILLSSSDAGFGAALEGLMNGLMANFQLNDAVSRIIASFIALLYFLGVLLSIRFHRDRPPMTVNSAYSQSPTISLIILGSVDALYALFTLTQLRTLYFPRTQLTAMNQGIADYARSGFFSLLLVLVINLFLLWYLSTYTRKSGRLVQAMKAGYLLMFLFTANMIASSFYKMALYESEYGYTHLRIVVKFALIFFSLGLIILVLFVLKRIRDVLTPLTILAISLYMILNIINVEGIIATRAHGIYLERGRLDTAYLSGLSADAYRSMEKAFDFSGSADPRIIELKETYLKSLYHDLSSETFTAHPLARTITELNIKP